jgi:predicted enzyme related to lactoylglutathione lyase
MPNRLAHFAIEADDVDRARRFYEQVFEWSFEPWGPPGFYLIRGAGLLGSLQSRREPMPQGRKGFECSFAVDDLGRSTTLVVAAGGTVGEHAHAIPGVGRLVEFHDSEGNQAILIEYEPARRREMGL